MQHSYKRPIDRPYRIYCRVCEKSVLSTQREWVSPDNLRESKHLACGATGRLVYLFENTKDLQERRIARIPAEITMGFTKPHCGDANCSGLCSDPLCDPTGIVLSKGSLRLEELSYLWLNRTKGVLQRLRKLWTWDTIWQTLGFVFVAGLAGGLLTLFLGWVFGKVGT